MKNILLSLSFMLCVSIGYPDQNAMQNDFAQGFKAAKEKNRDEAIQWFSKAGNEAIVDRNWQGALDAGNALTHMGEPKSAKNLFIEADQIAQTGQDWRSMIAVGYAFASLPPNPEKEQLTSNAFAAAAAFANNKKDWLGLTEAANGLLHMNKKQDAIQILDMAKTIVDKVNSEKGAQVLAKLYEKSGSIESANAMLNAQQQYAAMYENAQSSSFVPPPPGWNPVGETVAGPPVIDIEIQKANRAAADSEIAAKNEYILQQKQIEHELEMKANEYANYYYYPYGSTWASSYEPWGWDEITPWADHYLSYYSYDNGHYAYSHGSYTGFGFSFGYSEHNGNEHLSFGFGVYSD
ncbi:MAG: hypothetical protein Q8Q33_01485 [Chlamydiota bacterium]|nr:hypothetical protein [Chlamydiota bacterium]